MKIIDYVKKFLTKVFWPYFKKSILPLIKDALIDITKDVFSRLREIVSERLKRREEASSKEYRRKASEADKNARSSTDEVEAAKWRAKAEAYYEFVKELRRENEKLRNDVEEAVRAAEKKTERDIVDLDLEQNDDIVSIGGRDLPALPEGELSNSE
mgnify:CR=1 FL=1